MITLYFDMDRVLTDFGAQADKFKALNKNNRVNWLKVFFLGKKFWSEMAWFPGAKDAFPKIKNFCEENNIKLCVLSSVRLTSGRIGKMEWCKKNLGIPEENIFLVKAASMKSSYANCTSILVDDNKGNVESFISAGGNGIVFSKWDDITVEKIFDKLLTQRVDN